MTNLILSIVYFTISGILCWLQIFGKMRWEWMSSPFFVYTIAMVIAFFLFYGSQYCVEYFGSTWSARFLTFSANTVTFAIMSSFLIGENIDLKTGICLGLSCVIVGIQIFW